MKRTFCCRCIKRRTSLLAIVSTCRRSWKEFPPTSTPTRSPRASVAPTSTVGSSSCGCGECGPFVGSVVRLWGTWGWHALHAPLWRRLLRSVPVSVTFCGWGSFVGCHGLRTTSTVGLNTLGACTSVLLCALCGWLWAPCLECHDERRSISWSSSVLILGITLHCLWIGIWLLWCYVTSFLPHRPSSEFCVEARQGEYLFYAANGGVALIVLGLIHFLMCLAANYAHIKGSLFILSRVYCLVVAESVCTIIVTMVQQLGFPT